MNNEFDIVLNYEASKSLIEQHGWDSFLDYLKAMFPERELYKVSKDWLYHTPGSFSCKAVGSCGDLLIGWDKF